MSKSNTKVETPYRRPIEYSPYLKDTLISIFSKLEYPFRNNLFKIGGLPDDILGEIKRFLICLDAYLESSNPLQKPGELLVLAAMGPEGSSIQKRIKRSSILKTFNTSTYEVDQDLENVPSYFFKEIGDIFNYNYLPLWKEEVDDYKEGFTPLRQDEDLLALFRKILSDILPDNINIIDEREILLENSSSSCYLSSPREVVNYSRKKKKKVISRSVKKTGKKYLEKQTQNSMASSIGTGLRTVIPASPQGFRDTVMLTVNSSNRVTWIDRQMMNVLSEMDLHIHLKENSLIRKRIKKFGKKFSFFVQRDIKKEGITKPRSLLKIMLEALKEAYPDAKAFEYTDFYDNFNLDLGQEKVYPIRGHGLGMANSLTTLMNIVIYLMAMSLDNSDYEIVQGESSSLSLNDDFVAGFESEEDSNNYQDRELYVMTGLGIIYAPKKSFCSYEKFVIAEEYWPRNHSKKESYYRAEVLSSLACMNIVHAKLLVNSFINIDNIEYWELYKEEVISKWGYEFFPEEYKYPHSCGGWVSYVANQVSLDLKILEELDYKRKIYAAFKAAKYSTPKVFCSKNESSYKSPYIKILGNIKVTDDLRSYIDLGTIGEISSKYFVFRNNPERAENAFSGLLEKRKKEFNKWNSIPAPNFNDFIDEYIKEEIDYYPLDHMIKSYIKVDHLAYKTASDIWLSPTPILSALSKENPHLTTLKGENYSLLAAKNKPQFTPDSSSWIKLNEEKLIYSFSLSVDWNVKRVLPIARSREDEVLMCKSYINPIAVAQLCNAIGYIEIPVLHEKYWKIYSIEKERIFGFFPPLKLIPTLSRIGRDLIEAICSVVTEPDDLEVLLIDILDECESERQKRKTEEVNPPDLLLQETEEETFDRLTSEVHIESPEDAENILRDYRYSNYLIAKATTEYRSLKYVDQSKLAWGRTHIRESMTMKTDIEYLNLAVTYAQLNCAEELLFKRIRELERIEAQVAEDEEADMALAMSSLFEEG